MHKIKKSFTILLLLLGTQLSAQTAISGRISFEDSSTRAEKVYLTKLDVAHLQNLKYAKEVAWEPIHQDGSFSFDRKHISNKDAVYLMYVNQMEKAIQDTIAKSGTFILSSSDSIHFPKSNGLFADYTNTNPADQEWKRLQQFEAKVLQSQFDEAENAFQLKRYAKDSLRILTVKLIAIRQLENKRLLDQDISENPSYYLDLLEELKESEIEPEQYVFLEKKLAFLTQEVVEQKYAWSKIINFILGFLVLGLGTILVYRRKKQPVLSDLSRQERTIKTLILEGKSNKEIASELFISLSTVKTHITHIYGKLKVSSRQELLRKTRN
jgi:DNA-binding CsgD family transcriptional regulator